MLSTDDRFVSVSVLLGSGPKSISANRRPIEIISFGEGGEILGE